MMKDYRCSVSKIQKAVRALTGLTPRNGFQILDTHLTYIHIRSLLITASDNFLLTSVCPLTD